MGGWNLDDSFRNPLTKLPTDCKSCGKRSGSDEPGATFATGILCPECGYYRNVKPQVIGCEHGEWNFCGSGPSFDCLQCRLYFCEQHLCKHLKGKVKS